MTKNTKKLKALLLWSYIYMIYASFFELMFLCLRVKYQEIELLGPVEVLFLLFGEKFSYYSQASFRSLREQ